METSKERTKCKESKRVVKFLMSARGCWVHSPCIIFGNKSCRAIAFRRPPTPIFMTSFKTHKFHSYHVFVLLPKELEWNNIRINTPAKRDSFGFESFFPGKILKRREKYLRSRRQQQANERLWARFSTNAFQFSGYSYFQVCHLQSPIYVRDVHMGAARINESSIISAFIVVSSQKTFTIKTTIERDTIRRIIVWFMRKNSWSKWQTMKKIIH